jgi:hypothetical protein
MKLEGNNNNNNNNNAIKRKKCVSFDDCLKPFSI